MTTIAEWLATQEGVARERLKHSEAQGQNYNAQWYGGQAAAFEAAHAYAVARPDPAAPAAKGGTEDGKAARLIRRLALVGELLRERSIPGMIDGDLYVAVKNEGQGTGWRYVCSGALVSDLDEARAIVSPPPPAGDAGGGSGDLAALSAGATPGPWRTGTTRLNNPDLWERSPVVPAISPDRPYAGMILRGTALTKEEDAAFVVALVNAYRYGRLIEAPIPDLGAQGEPVAWIEPGDIPPLTDAYGFLRASPVKYDRFIRPLYGAPAAPRSGSGVTVEGIEKKAAQLREEAKACEAVGSYTGADQANAVAAAYEEVLALHQAPRPGETPAGHHLAEVTNEDVDWLAREAVRTGDRTLARIATALKVGRQ